MQPTLQTAVLLDPKIWELTPERLEPTCLPLSFLLPPGVYVCAKCGYELFSSLSKYAHSSPWPAFTETIHADSVAKRPEHNLPKALKVGGSSRRGWGGALARESPRAAAPSLSPPPSGLRVCLFWKHLGSWGPDGDGGQACFPAWAPSDLSCPQLLWEVLRGITEAVLWSFQVSCGKCGNGLGHEFLNDGPKPGQSRF